VLNQPGTLNAYTYALNNPLRYTDPSGEFIDAPLDLAFILFETGSLGMDAVRFAFKRRYSMRKEPLVNLCSLRNCWPSTWFPGG
jgi:hypothetical protein